MKENAEALVAHINAINAQLERLDEELKKKLPPDLYTKLTNENRAFEQRIEISQKAGKAFAAVSGITTAVVVGTIVSTKLTSVISSTVGRIAVSSVVGALLVPHLVQLWMSFLEP